MVLKKRIYDGGFHGLLAPVIPKAPRSIRRRNSRNKSSEDGGICAFELLADVADKLLQQQESESSTNSIPEEAVKNELLEVKVKPVVSGVGQPFHLDTPLNELPHSENDSGSDHASIVTNADFEKKVNGSLIHEAEIQPKDVEKQSVGLTSVKTYLEPCVNANKSSSSVHLSLYKDPFHSAGFPRYMGNVDINVRDDDEKYFKYNNRSIARIRAFRSRSRAGYKRMRKMMPSRYWKAARKVKDYQFPNSIGGGVKSCYHKRKNMYMKERFQADAVFKRRKVCHQSSRNSHIKNVNSESVSNLIKFSIKSFKVPELYVEVPETATVGSLKRSVMDAVTSILHGKLHVGVLVQGKKVRDDSRTLQQSGISQNCNLETLGFTLEPSLPEDYPFLVQQETPSCNMQQQLSRSPSSPNMDGTTMENHSEKNEKGTTFTADVTTKEAVDDSKALVLVPAVDAEVLSAVPLSEQRTKRYEFSQRRTRRPFSVSEVEALVEAVETLGAGRWRDVKVRAFDDADHRTYVDLKDKWKTLVHTASIGPQQRRGEPVPQDLLDRVLAAHAYWSQHQAKQNVKKHQKTSEAVM